MKGEDDDAVVFLHPVNPALPACPPSSMLAEAGLERRRTPCVKRKARKPVSYALKRTDMDTAPSRLPDAAEKALRAESAICGLCGDAGNRQF